MAITTNGVLQWKFQRAANLLTVIVGATLLCIFMCCGISSYGELNELVSATWFRLLFGISLVVFAVNSLLAGWQIAGDYAKKIHLPVSLLVLIVAVISFLYVVYGLSLLF